MATDLLAHRREQLVGEVGLPRYAKRSGLTTPAGAPTSTPAPIAVPTTNTTAEAAINTLRPIRSPITIAAPAPITVPTSTAHDHALPGRTEVEAPLDEEQTEEQPAIAATAATLSAELDRRAPRGCRG